jgi:hypothetical protein
MPFRSKNLLLSCFKIIYKPYSYVFWYCRRSQGSVFLLRLRLVGRHQSFGETYSVEMETVAHSHGIVNYLISWCPLPGLVFTNILWTICLVSSNLMMFYFVARSHFYELHLAQGRTTELGSVLPVTEWPKTDYLLVTEYKHFDTPSV